ncbi:DUF4350 domain-containing protein [Aurantiacibacter gangjinensis]|uniref:Uncharacterized protein n=1 Tax=Aurantiacibacter gangjinensis TaxID=502682 RepID=A0A0G9MK28_9SPHN|nr:DUF4350 domain-containing protein [Aurantiacibacter gangjinensis]APE29309.1 hypothetical protein BMF35_b0054 [Aurantiacibacter gangjinensis]KLE31101.1 hypothetical protein AAW01_12755 [Aurantiacibacter gangjinensis]
MSRRANPFRPGVVLGVLLVGVLAFLMILYALGQGWTGQDERDGGSHAAANGLNGYSGLVQLLRGTGSDVTFARNPTELDDYNLTIITPSLFADAEAIDEVIQNRRDFAGGPTIIILPKWSAFEPRQRDDVEIEDGWVVLGNASSPFWFEEIGIFSGGEMAVGETGGWQGLGTSGDLPDEEQVQALVSATDQVMTSLIVDDEGDVLVAELSPAKPEDVNYDTYVNDWPIIVVFEPDLMNNYGMADRDRAALALSIIERAQDGAALPVVFDLTLNGLGRSDNLLTLAFSPPFLAATLCLLLAALVVAWRGFRRFGPPVAEAPAMARGKEQLARNGASLLERVKRWHLLKQPYEDMIGRRVAASLGLRIADTDAREAAIDDALDRRGHDGPPFSRLAADLRAADKPRDIIRAAKALRTFERTLTS